MGWFILQWTVALAVMGWAFYIGETSPAMTLVAIAAAYFATKLVAWALDRIRRPKIVQTEQEPQNSIPVSPVDPLSRLPEGWDRHIRRRGEDTGKLPGPPL